MRDAAYDMICRRLGTHIGRVIVEHDRRRGRTDLDDRSAICHRLDHLLIELERSDQLQRRHHLQFFLGVFEKRLEKTDAGRIDGDIHTADLALRRFGQSLDVGFLGQVAQRVMTANVLGKALQFFFFPSGNQHLRAFVMKAFGDYLPHIIFARGSQNYRFFSF